AAQRLGVAALRRAVHAAARRSGAAAGAAAVANDADVAVACGPATLRRLRPNKDRTPHRPWVWILTPTLGFMGSTENRQRAERPSSAAAAAPVSYELPETEMAAAVCRSDWFGPALEFPPGCNPAALNNPTTHALPQAVNRTGTTPCCKARSRFPSSR